MYRASFSAIMTGFTLSTMLFGGAGEANAQDADTVPSIEGKTEGMQKMDGFIPLFWDADEGKMWMEIGRFEEELLHYTSLPAGLGQNDLGLNRGDLGPQHVVVFRRVGPRVLMEEPNQRFRAISDDPMERKSVLDGFPPSVHWGWEIAAQTDARVLVDATDFFLTDWHGVIPSLRRSNQGTWKLDKGRSALYLARTRTFPKNSEIEVTLTFTSDDPGSLVRSVSASAGALTVRQHHSFVELPTGYEPRAADPRAGYGGISFMDFATPIGEPLAKRYISRHRLEKVDPSAAVSDPVEPIIYYLDPGTPEPVRTALITGGNMWNQAFEAAGYRNAFRVEVLPDDADPMDLRYNVIQWVHRSTRGWSYGSSVRDPRTGEILKGHVTIGSLRVRQDYLLAEGLLSPYDDGDAVPTAMSEMALARIRQLSAHEIGHTLGLSHNYIASTQRSDGPQSVMDYPHPRIGLNGGRIDVLDAYENEIGAWDKVAIRYGYQDFPGGTDEAAALDRILEDALDDGITFITDQDARPAGSAHPLAHLWDNGANAATELDRMMDVRSVALSNFSEAAIRNGQPLATLEEALVPLYLHHRYQVEATAKVLGGLYYTYALRGDGQQPLRPVPGSEQERAMEALLRTLDPSELTLPDNVLELIPPRPAGYRLHRELFRRYTGLVFDAISPAVVAADNTVAMILQPERAARLVQQEARDHNLPGLGDVIRELVEATFEADVDNGYEAEVSRAVQRVVVDRLMGLAARAPMPQVRAVASLALDDLAERSEQWTASDSGDADRAHFYLIAKDVRRFLDRPMDPGQTPASVAAPPGSPIGDPGLWSLPSWAGLIQDAPLTCTAW